VSLGARGYRTSRRVQRHGSQKQGSPPGAGNVARPSALPQENQDVLKKLRQMKLGEIECNRPGQFFPKFAHNVTHTLQRVFHTNYKHDSDASLVFGASSFLVHTLSLCCLFTCSHENNNFFTDSSQLTMLV
jgi:hypothetical protein